MNVSLTILILPRISILIHNNVYYWNVHSCSLSCFQTDVDRVSTFGIVFLTEVSTAVVLQLISSVSTSFEQRLRSP